MHTRFLLPHGPQARLSRKDLIEFEQLLKDSIHAFLPFSSYSLHFPASLPEEMRTGDGFSPSTAVHLAQERKVLLPLFLKGEFLGVFVARGVRLRPSKGLLANLARSAELCLEKLLLVKAGRTDPLTGLLTRDCFLTELAREIELIRDCIGPGTNMSCRLPSYRACLGAILIRVDSLPELQREHGFAFADEVMRGLALSVEEMRPDQAIAARYDENAMALLLPGALSSACHKTARVMASRLGSMIFPRNILGEHVTPRISAGSVAYPNDLHGALFELSPVEQARMLMQRTRVAADAAEAQGSGRAFAFGRILREGGKVLEVLPGNRLMVNLGRNVNAREGCCFLVRASGVSGKSGDGKPVEPKAEIALLEVMTDQALAEVSLLLDPLCPVAPGDRLMLAEDRVEASPEVAAQAVMQSRPDPATGLYSYQDFLLAASREIQNHDRFCLALVRLSILGNGSAQEYLAKAETLAAQAADLGRELLGEGVLAGRLSLAGAAFLHPDMDPDETRRLYQVFHREIMLRTGVEAVVGIAFHPCLTFVRSDIFENARKALDYARLLEPPRIGVFDSLALNIHADRLSLANDLYGAIEEYKLALLSDEENTIARVSLGVCLARLGRYDQAKHHFQEVLARDPRDHTAVYNLGYVCQRTDDLDGARQAYQLCLKLKPDHVYSIIRLGRTAELEGDLDEARSYYRSAALVNGGHALVPRYLARLDMKQDRLEEAKEHLQQALHQDPNDALALHLLAKLYLDRGEDPEIAETFARQSVALRPDRQPFWLELARAFEAQGKVEQARTAMARCASA